MVFYQIFFRNSNLSQKPILNLMNIWLANGDALMEGFCVWFFVHFWTYGSVNCFAALRLFIWGTIRLLLSQMDGNIFKGKKDKKTVAKKVYIRVLIVFLPFVPTNYFLNFQAGLEVTLCTTINAYKSVIWGLKICLLSRLLFKVLLEQLTAAPWINFCFMMYHGLVVEGIWSFSRLGWWLGWLI